MQQIKKYRNKEWLEDQYINKKKSMNDIAKICNISSSTIRKWLIKFKIRIRTHSEAFKSNSGQFQKGNTNWKHNKYIGIKLICKECKEEFINTHMRQKFCSVECQQKNYSKRNKEVRKRNNRKHILKAYNLTLEHFDRLKKINNNKCWICGCESHTEELCVDHNHKTNDIRGLLCHNCNKTLGIINENPFILIKMVHYLNKKPVSFNQSIKDIIEEIGDTTTFLQRFEQNPNIFSVNLK